MFSKRGWTTLVLITLAQVGLVMCYLGLPKFVQPKLASGFVEIDSAPGSAPGPAPGSQTGVWEPEANGSETETPPPIPMEETIPPPLTIEPSGPLLPATFNPEMPPPQANPVAPKPAVAASGPDWNPPIIPDIAAPPKPATDVNLLKAVDPLIPAPGIPEPSKVKLPAPVVSPPPMAPKEIAVSPPGQPAMTPIHDDGLPLPAVKPIHEIVSPPVPPLPAAKPMPGKYVAEIGPLVKAPDSPALVAPVKESGEKAKPGVGVNPPELPPAPAHPSPQDLKPMFPEIPLPVITAGPGPVALPPNKQGSAKPLAANLVLSGQAKCGLPQVPPAVAKDQFEKPSPWQFQVAIVDQRTVLTAKTAKGATFVIRCASLKLNRPGGNVEASGKVFIEGKDWQGSCDRLTIAWGEDRLWLEGNARLNRLSNGEVIELNGPQLQFHMSFVQPD